MTQPTAAIAKLVDKNNNAQIGNRGVSIAELVVLTDNSGGTANDTLQVIGGLPLQAEVANNFADVAAKINEIIANQILIIDTLEAHGLIADN